MADPDPTEPLVVASASIEVPAGLDIRPAATPAEVAAILAAYTELWPQPAASVTPSAANDWRFAGRWWRGIGPRARLPVRR